MKRITEKPTKEQLKAWNPHRCENPLTRGQWHLNVKEARYGFICLPTKKEAIDAAIAASKRGRGTRG